MHIRNNEYTMLSLIYKANKNIDSFTLFKRSKINFPGFTKIISSLSEKRLIGEDEDKIYLTKEGIRLTSIYNSSLSLNGAEWRKIPNEMTGKKISTNEFYIPSIKNLDKRSFQLIQEDLK